MNISKLQNAEMMFLFDAYYKQNKKVFIYGDLSNGQEFIYQNHIDEMVFAYLTDDKTVSSDFYGKPVYCIFDIAYEKPGSYFIIVYLPEKNPQEVFRVLSGMLGLCAGNDYIYYQVGNYYPGQLRDSQLSFSRYYNEWDNKYPGFKIFGRIDAKLKILTLGGSTSDPTLCGISSWSECLYYDLKKLGFDVSVFCGGFSAYISYQEMQKLIRDGLSIQPNIVISYSGMNDLTYQVYKDDLNRFQRHYLDQDTEKLFRWLHSYEGNPVILGVKTTKDACQYWIDNERIMNAICKEFGIEHFAVFQPSAFQNESKPQALVSYIKYMLSYEYYNFHKLNYLKYLRTLTEQVENGIANLPYITSFRRIFDDVAPMDLYYDQIHVYECGNEIIATNMIENLINKGYIPRQEISSKIVNNY